MPVKDIKKSNEKENLLLVTRKKLNFKEQPVANTFNKENIGVVYAQHMNLPYQRSIPAWI